MSTTITKTCPSCSDPNLNLLPPDLETVMKPREDFIANNFPIVTKARYGGLPHQVRVKCGNCGNSSTWNLDVSNPESTTIDYVAQG